MPGESSLDGGKGNSLVFTFSGELLKDEDLFAPEPDFLHWLDKSLFVDVSLAGDEAEYDKLTKEERKAWKLFHDAVEATGNLLDLFKSNLPLFQKVAKQMMFLPCFLSRHPDNQRFNRVLFENSRLSQRDVASGWQPKTQHLARQSWPVRYAYAIIAAIDLTLDTYEDRLPVWAETYGYGVKHPIPMSQYEEAVGKLGWDEERKRLELPHYVGSYKILPAWTKGLERLRRPFNADHVLDYWHSGKEMILEEMPNFHLKPEWKDYHRRRYKSGRKKGAIQHAIFKDILAALRTIAGSHHRQSPSKKVTK